VPLKIAHISDTHLGYKSFGATEAGVNQREVDVLRTFKQALDQMLLRDPDIVIHSGDMFDVVRPSNYTLVHTFRMLTDFQRKRNGKPFLIVAGNHETPRNAESGNILQLFEAIEGVFIEAKMGKTVFFESLDLEVLCIPNASLVSRENIAMVPTGNSKYSILAVHGVETKIQTELKKADATDFDLTERDTEQWTYVALGDYHVHKLYGPNACYAGSTDYTSTNFWDELKKPKGWVWFDTSVGMLEFINVKPRSVIDLPFIDASKHIAAELEEVLSSAAIWETADLPIVRQLVTNVRPEVWAQIGFGRAASCWRYVNAKQ
jgi:DNA repair exonuclease SbcCD nuclease subunit